MKVKELIELLESQDPNLTVILARDPEGNGYHLFSGDASVGLFNPDSSDWDAYASLGNIEEYPHEEEYAYLKENGLPALCLWPQDCLGV
jgi:hypothetical protein